MLKTIIIILILGILALSIIPLQTIYRNYTTPIEFITPTSNNLNNHKMVTPQTNQNQYIVLGFVPYWLINKSKYIPYQSITHLAYFGIEFDDQAKLKTRLKDGTRELGNYRLHQPTVQKIIKSTLHANHQPVLTVKILNNSGIESAIDSSNRKQIIKQIIEIMQKNSFTGINIDFEYIHSPSQKTQTDFTEFIKTLRQQLNAACTQLPDNCSLTIDIYPDTADKQSNRLWQLSDLAPHVDNFIVMGYDYHRTTTPKSGPVAPIHGSPEYWEEDLSTNLRSITQEIPPQKIILGIPFYGYEWSTLTSQPLSSTIVGTGRLATYSRIKKLLNTCDFVNTIEELDKETDQLPCLLNFDPLAMTPHLRYQINNKHQQIWYENTQSIKYKLQLIKQAGFAGVAIWALGYEAPYQDIWDTINTELKTQ